MQKKLMQPPKNSNNSIKSAKVVQKVAIGLVDKKLEANHSGFKNKDQVLLNMVKEFLQISGYIRSYQTLKTEKPNLRGRVHLSRPQSKRELDKHNILQLFDKGNRQQFFRQTQKILSQQLMQSFQFQLNIYFCFYSIHPNLKKQSTIDKASIEAFKKYLDTRGSELSENNQFLSYFAIPYISKPQEHSLYAHFFTKDWIARLREKLFEVLSNFQKKSNFFHQDDNSKKISQLQQMFYEFSTKVRSSQEECKESCSHLIEIDRLKMDNSSLRQTMKKIQTKFQEFIESSKTNLIESNQKWFNFSREIFGIAQKHIKEDKIKLIEKYSSFFKMNAGDHLQGKQISLFDKDDMSVTPDTSNQKNSLKRHQMNQYSQIDLNRIRNVFLLANYKDKQLEICIILKALKYRLTQKSSHLQRREIITDYVRADIIGINEVNYMVQKRLLFDGGQRIKLCYLELMRTITTYNYSLQLLAKSIKLMQNLIGMLSIEHEDNSCRKLVLIILQRMSFTKESSRHMMRLGIIPIMFNIFKSEVSDLTIQFLIATWMNLSFRKESYPYFEAQKIQLISIFKDLMVSENKDICDYSNKTIFILLSVSKQIKAEALRQNFDSFLQNLLGFNNLFVDQYTYILKLLREEYQPEVQDAYDLFEYDEEDFDFSDEEQYSFTESSDQDCIDDFNIANGQDCLVKNYALLGPDAIREQVLTRSLLDQTSKRLNNTSVNISRRMEHIFGGKEVQQLLKLTIAEQGK